MTSRAWIVAVVLGAGVALAGCGGGQPAAVQTSSATAVQGSATGTQPVAGPTAQRVVDAFSSAGLPVPKVRDNSKNCAGLGIGCSQMITTDAITVVVFPDSASATKYATTAGVEAHQQGLVVLSYLAARTPAADRPKYEAELGKLAG
jgi:hypothetical protein